MNEKVSLPLKLYKYCDHDTFFNILKSKKIWLTTNSNDEEEFLIVQNLINEFRQSNSVALILDNIFRNHSLRLKPFMTCFSEDPDNIAMWEMYAKNSTGFVIGIDPRAFGIASRFPFSHIKQEFAVGFKKVIYSSEEQKNKFNYIVEKIASEDHLQSISELQCLSYIFKNSSWKSENEWRIIYLPYFIDETSDLSLAMRKTLPHEPLNANLTVKPRKCEKAKNTFDYCELDLNLKNNKTAISEIIIGKYSKYGDYSVSQIEELLTMLEIGGVNIRKSSSTLKK